MVDPVLGLAVVFNGLIYNYRELRSDLEAVGYSFWSRSDTEVMLKAYHHWGDRFVCRLVGMFAFALVETASGRVVDRPGRPASLPLLACGRAGAPHHPARGAQARAGHAADRRARRAPGTRTATGRRASSAGSTTASSAPRTGRTPVREALRVAVRRRMVSDVPVGVLLSGGLDSSLIVALLAEQGQAGLQTFSIGFPSAGGNQGDEFVYSDSSWRPSGPTTTASWWAPTGSSRRCRRRSPR
jgi:asparagine synthase (glutamine-hydrolysing)